MPVSFRKCRFKSRAAARLLRDYLEFKVTRGFTRYANGVVYTARDFDRYLTELALFDIQQLDEQAMVNWIFGPPVVPDGTKNRRILFLRGFWQYLIRRGLLKNNPALAISLLPVRRKAPYIYSLMEISRLLQETAKFPDPVGVTVKTILYLLYACGLRLNEGLRLKIQDIDFEERTLALWNTKFHKERLVPFSRHAEAVLRAYLGYRKKRCPGLRPADSVFSFGKDKRTQVSDATMRRYFDLIRQRCSFSPSANARRPRLHDLRHAFAVHRLYKWYQEGANLLNKLPLLSTYMGHASPHDTQVYLTITESLLREGDGRFREAFEKVTDASLKLAFKNP
jgi:site-specific recombinase XerD